MRKLFHRLHKNKITSWIDTSCSVKSTFHDKTFAQSLHLQAWFRGKILCVPTIYSPHQTCYFIVHIITASTMKNINKFIGDLFFTETLINVILVFCTLIKITLKSLGILLFHILITINNIFKHHLCLENNSQSAKLIFL